MKNISVNLMTVAVKSFLWCFICLVFHFIFTYPNVYILLVARFSKWIFRLNDALFIALKFTPGKCFLSWVFPQKYIIVEKSRLKTILLCLCQRYYRILHGYVLIMGNSNIFSCYLFNSFSQKFDRVKNWENIVVDIWNFENV